jgi:hypothetical protein
MMTRTDVVALTSMTEEELRAMLMGYAEEIPKHEHLPSAPLLGMIGVVLTVLDEMADCDTDEDAQLDRWCRLSENAMRGLGFVEGTLWACGVYEIGRLRHMPRVM